MTKTSRLMALHRAELAGRKAAEAGAESKSCPYKGRSGSAKNYRDAWLRGFHAHEVVELYRVCNGELSCVACRREDVSVMDLGVWAAVATADNGIVVEVIFGDRTGRFRGQPLTELVRGDMQSNHGQEY